MRGLPPVAASGGHSSSRCAGLSLSRPLSLRSTGSRRAGSAIVAHGPSCSAARGILPDQGSNPRPLHWQADSQPLRHQGSPRNFKPLGTTATANIKHSPTSSKINIKTSTIYLLLLPSILPSTFKKKKITMHAKMQEKTVLRNKASSRTRLIYVTDFKVRQGILNRYNQ